jgi:hypothetical protein
MSFNQSNHENKASSSSWKVFVQTELFQKEPMPHPAGVLLGELG